MKMFQGSGCHLISQMWVILIMGSIMTSCSFSSMHDGVVHTSIETIPLPIVDADARAFFALDDSIFFFGSILKSNDGQSLSVFRTEDGGITWRHHANFVFDSFPFVFFDSMGDYVYLGLSSSSVDNPHCAIYITERYGDAWKEIFSEKKRLESIHVWPDGVALVLSDDHSNLELLVSDDGGRSWNVKETPFPTSSGHYAFSGERMIAEISNHLVSFGLIPETCDTIYSPPLIHTGVFSGKHEIIWQYTTTEDYVILHEGYISKCLAICGDSLELRSRIKSEEAPGAKIPVALYSKGDTIFVTLQNLAYELRTRTLVSVDGGRHWRDLYEGRFASAQGGSLYSIGKNKDGQDCLFKTTVRPWE